jgi:Domain of unknown function (DUF1844)
MSEEKKSAFKVSDRRKFTVEGETRPDATPSQSTATADAPPPPPPPFSQEPPPGAPVAEISPEATRPKTPTAEEASATHNAYKDSVATLDADLHAQYGPEVSKEMEANFGRIVEPFYVTALMQLGMMGQEGPQRQVDIVGARQTIDTLSFLHEKMKSNLSKEEETFIQTVLYQVRVAYVDVSNAIARAATQGTPGGGPGGFGGNNDPGFNTPLR